ncbi:MAG: ribokinase [Muribaculaceae bacterium]|nr:ribokinase [Muribaculaceae bacterium]
MNLNTNKPAICCIGHITLDKVITPRHTAYMPGGTAFYFGHAMARLHANDFLLVTALAPSEKRSVDMLREAGVEVKVLPSHNSVYFENSYGENSNDRSQRVLAKADPFSVEGLRGVEAGIFHLGTLLADDFPMEVLKDLAGKGRVSIDAQGYLREVRGEKVFAVDWPEKTEALKYVDILKANEHEMEVLTGSRDPRTAALKLADMGVREVVLTLGDQGSLIYADGEFYEIPAYKPKDVVDATGCGDTYMAGYLFKRGQGCGIYESGCYAAAMCTIKLASSGPFSGTPEDIKAVIENKS